MFRSRPLLFLAVLATGSISAALAQEIDHGHGLVGAFTAGCPITVAVPTDKIKTVAGMYLVAERAGHYFNLHTTAQTFFGDMRGQLHAPLPR